MKRNQGSVLLPHNTDNKLGRPVMKILRENHPEAKEPLASDFPNLGATPTMPPVVIGATVMKAVATQLLGVDVLSVLNFSMDQSWHL